jgi:hypothetical protein
MSYQYLLSGTPYNQNNVQNLRLIEYNAMVNPLELCLIQGNQYIVRDPSYYGNKSYNIQNSNQVYTNQITYNQQMNMLQNQNKRQTFPFHRHNNYSQPQIQINQNFPQQIYFKNNIQILQGQQQIKPNIPLQHNQKVQPLILQKPQTQQNQIISPKKQIQQQPQILNNFQFQKNPLIQPNNLNQEFQLQQQGYMPGEIQYQKYIKKYPFQNQNKKINIEYNEKDEHFVKKKEIYPENKHPSYNYKAKSSQKQKKQIKVLPRNEILNKGIKIEGTNNNIELLNNKDGLFNKAKLNNNKLSIEEENEKEIDIKHIEASNRISQISNISKDVKEYPIEEKKPEPIFSELMDHNQNIIVKKSISQSGISDYVANLSHLPTINSLLRGNSELLPLKNK